MGLSTSASAHVHVVDLEGQGDFIAIQPAIDAATDGDVLLIRAPRRIGERYAGFEIAGKSLTLVGQGRPHVLTGTACVRGLSPDQLVTLVGLDLNRAELPEPDADPQETDGPGLAVVNSAGAVRVERCFLEGASGDRLWSGLQLIGALDVSLLDCEVLGAGPAELALLGGSGVQAVASRLCAYRCTIRGGPGFESELFNADEGGTGGTGMHLSARSVAWLSGGAVIGGRGGDSFCAPYPCVDHPGRGGTGLIVQPGSVCALSQTNLVRGPGGTSPFGSHQGGAPGSVSTGIFSSDDATHVEYSLASGGRSGNAVRITVSGPPGDEVLVAIGHGGSYRFLGPGTGVLGVDQLVGGGGLTSLGVIPLGGTLVSQLALPVTSSDEAEQRMVQILVRRSLNEIRLSAPQSVVTWGDDVPTLLEGERIFVDSARPAGLDGRTWSSAFSDLGEALRLAPSDADSTVEIWVREGRYPVPDRDGFHVPAKTRLVGGFAGGESQASQADGRAHPTILDGDRLGNGSTPNTLSDNAITVLRLGDFETAQLASETEVSGFQIRNSVGAQSVYASGIQVYGNAALVGCTVTGCESWNGAVHLIAGELLIDRCSIVGNRGRLAGAFQCSPFGAESASVRIHSSEVLHNSAFPMSAARSGGLYVRGADLVELIGVTFAGNDGAGEFGAAHIQATDSIRIHNCIAHGNSNDLNPFSPTPVSKQIYAVGHAPADVHFCVLEHMAAAIAGNGNFEADPTFAGLTGPDGIPGTADDSARLQSGSPAIDAGASQLFPASAAFDVVGGPRFRDDPAAPDVGTGGTRIVDVGAHEH
ncbi:MAG: right-handed parallel beta-helix repeat-containing protein [Planctomycetota bacterium]